MVDTDDDGPNSSARPLPTTSRLAFRNFELTDFDAVHAYASDPVVTRYTSFGPNTEEETRGFLERMCAAAVVSSRRDYTLAVVERKHGTLIGGVGLAASDATRRQYALGYCFGRGSWGKGLGREAATAMVEFGFEVLSAHRLWAFVFVGNDASVRILEKCGFRQEGLARQSVFARGTWHDVQNFALLRSDRAS